MTLPSPKQKRNKNLSTPSSSQASAAPPSMISALSTEPLHAPNMLHKHASRSPPGSPFPQFDKLPAELRLMIWTFAAHIPRRLNLTDDLHPRADGSCAPPALLAVCREARDVALKSYGPCVLHLIKS
ncbi:hypothetical protein BU16DRAFT_523851 [Lophium mytilinum]|uniref:2EXR domain-containing protein n=1 Tax=Lophium mytilinum TaxID=390894 RepID=A0A6A6R788_9PEZI|nr:hypothetical protein BU16DRAFT_523851 [Lophium mytilinum]